MNECLKIPFENLEECRSIDDTYVISSDGKVFKRPYLYWHSRGKKYIYIGWTTLKGQKNNDGYTSVTLHNKAIPLHRLVAKAFPEICGQWFDGCVVHHIDHNSNNNKASNLKIMSREEHIKHHKKSNITKKKKEKMIAKYTTELQLIDIYDSVEEVCSIFPYDKFNIRKCCRGKLKTAYGFKWSYI